MTIPYLQPYYNEENRGSFLVPIKDDPSIQAYLQKTYNFAYQLANPIVKNSQNRSGFQLPATVHIGDTYSGVNIGSFGSRTTTVIYPESSEAKQMKDEQSARIVVGIIAIVVGGFATYILGKSYAQNESITLDYNEVERCRMITSHSFDPTIQNFNFILDTHVNILTRMQNSARWKLACTVGIVAGSALALIGALYAESALMTLGIGIGLIAGVGIVLRWGYDSISTANKREANQLINLINNFYQLHVPVPSAPPMDY